MWFKEVEKRLFSRVKAVVSAKYKTKYQNLNFTMDKSVYEPTALPTVCMWFYIAERGNDLENTGINAVDMTIQVKVFVSSGQNIGVAEDITYAVMQVLKEARFNVTMPELETSEGDSMVLISRYRRIIGANDII